MLKRPLFRGPYPAPLLKSALRPGTPCPCGDLSHRAARDTRTSLLVPGPPSPPGELHGSSFHWWVHSVFFEPRTASWPTHFVLRHPERPELPVFRRLSPTPCPGLEEDPTAARPQDLGLGLCVPGAPATCLSHSRVRGGPPRRTALSDVRLRVLAAEAFGTLL